MNRKASAANVSQHSCHWLSFVNKCMITNLQPKAGKLKYKQSFAFMLYIHFVCVTYTACFLNKRAKV